MDIKEFLGKKIKYLRQKKKLSQEQFAEIIDLNQRQIVRIETGKSLPTAETISKIARAFEISIQELFSDSEIFEKDFYKKQIISSLERLDKSKLCALYSITQNF